MTHRARDPAFRALFCLLGALVAPGALAGASVEKHYYDVEVGYTETLSQALDRATPVQKGRETFHGETHWEVHWEYELEQRPDGCRLASIDSTVETQMVLPRLVDSPWLDKDDRHRFSRYYQSLLAHERQHARHGRQAAQQVGQIRRLTARNCRALRSKLQTRVREIIARHEQKDRLYDERTDHGRHEGVFLE